eukprot:2304769-Pleurochrysis_carterae.AAC.1
MKVRMKTRPAACHRRSSLPEPRLARTPLQAQEQGPGEGVAPPPRFRAERHTLVRRGPSEIELCALLTPLPAVNASLHC